MFKFFFIIFIVGPKERWLRYQIFFSPCSCAAYVPDITATRLPRRADYALDAVAVDGGSACDRARESRNVMILGGVAWASLRSIKRSVRPLNTLTLSL